MAEMPAEIPAGYGMEKKIIGKPPGKTARQEQDPPGAGHSAGAPG